ncbi:hypothetical protein QOT17_020893 [Balamuthia mandrillaris]
MKATRFLATLCLLVVVCCFCAANAVRTPQTFSCHTCEVFAAQLVETKQEKNCMPLCNSSFPDMKEDCGQICKALHRAFAFLQDEAEQQEAHLKVHGGSPCIMAGFCHPGTYAERLIKTLF